MGNPFLFADRFSGAVVHLTTNYIATGGGRGVPAFISTIQTSKTKNARDSVN
jgi:hypothetical protein